jgi:hypothetical protein
MSRRVAAFADASSPQQSCNLTAGTLIPFTPTVPLPHAPGLRYNFRTAMNQQTAIEQIRDACRGIARELMRIHPAVPALGRREVQEELYKVLFELTKGVELIKKRLARLESKDEGTAL